MPTDNIGKGNCQKCSTNDCEKCYGTQTSNTCLNCFSSFVLTNDGNCISYSFEAIYFTDTDNKNIQLLSPYNYYPKYIKELVINNTRISSPSNSYTFQYKGKHKVHILFDISQLTTLETMFYSINGLLQISFTSKFDTKNINYFNRMFENCKSLIQINISSFDTSSVETMNNMFYNCEKLTSIDLSNFNNIKLKQLDHMLHGCSSLAYINITNFNTENVKLLIQYLMDAQA